MSSPSRAAGCTHEVRAAPTNGSRRSDDDRGPAVLHHAAHRHAAIPYPDLGTHGSGSPDTLDDPGPAGIAGRPPVRPGGAMRRAVSTPSTPRVVPTGTLRGVGARG